MAWDQKTINFFKMLIEDTLMEWDKHKKRYAYSMRRITIAVVFPYALIIGIKASFYKTFYALEVFQTSFAFVAIGLGINLVSYMKNKQEEQYDQQGSQQNFEQ